MIEVRITSHRGLYEQSPVYHPGFAKVLYNGTSLDYIPQDELVDLTGFLRENEIPFERLTSGGIFIRHGHKAASFDLEIA